MVSPQSATADPVEGRLHPAANVAVSLAASSQVEKWEVRMSSGVVPKT